MDRQAVAAREALQAGGASRRGRLEAQRPRARAPDAAVTGLPPPLFADAEAYNTLAFQLS
jgi:hypothetical protein